MNKLPKQKKDNSEKKRINYKLYTLFALGVITIFGLYRAVIFMVAEGMISGVWFSALMWTYLVLACAAFVAIYVLNRGFSGKAVTADELPPEWDHIKKGEYMKKDARRRKIAKYIMIPFVSFVFVFFWEIIEIFYLPGIKAWFDSF